MNGVTGPRQIQLRKLEIVTVSNFYSLLHFNRVHSKLPLIIHTTGSQGLKQDALSLDSVVYYNNQNWTRLSGRQIEPIGHRYQVTVISICQLCEWPIKINPGFIKNLIKLSLPNAHIYINTSMIIIHARQIYI